MHDEAYANLLALLRRLDGVWQSPHFHPEGDVLYHSLQVFEVARAETDDPELLAAALLHDVGKGQAGVDHGPVGADLVGDIVSPRVSWLVAHHDDLLYAPREIRLRLEGDPRLDELIRLRDWDLAGRSPGAWVQPLERSLGELFQPGLPEGWLAESAVKEDGL